MEEGTLHPVVQLRFGELPRSLSLEPVGTPFIVTIPPNHLQEFTYESGPRDECTMTFIDHTFGGLEQQIFEADRNEKQKGSLLLRWGYPDNGLETADWKTMKIVNYTPTISTAGLRITLFLYAFGAQGATEVNPTVYDGKISTVARAVAKDLGYIDETKIFIEETNDTRRDETPKKQWFTGNKSRIDFIQSKLLPEARSIANPNGTYEFRLGGEGTFEFCTQYFKQLAAEVHGSPEPENEVKRTPVQFTDSKGPKGRRYRQFEVLFGMPNGIIEWRPSYMTKAMGSFARSAIASVYDPRTKQHQQVVIDRSTQGMTSSKDPVSGGRTSSPPITDSKDKIEQRRKADSIVYQPAKQVALGGHCSGKQFHDHIGPDAARNVISSAWRRLHNSINSATLELYGLPRHADMSYLERFCEIAVILPDDAPQLQGNQVKEGTNQGLHWSSGRYQIKRIIHSITQGYIITAEFFRPTSGDGPDEAKTGPADEVPATITSAA